MEMQKLRRHISAVTGRIFFIGFSVQIALGLLWMISNFAGLQHFLGATIRLVLAFFANYVLLDSVAGSAKKEHVFCVWGSLALLTYPLAMQCHIAAPEDSVTASAVVLLLAFATRVIRRFSQNKTAKLWQYVLLVLVCMCLTLGIAIYKDAENDSKETYQSFELSMVSRFAWPRIGLDYAFWPGEIRANLSYDRALQSDIYAENVERVLGPSVVNAVGAERADELFAEMARGAWERHRGEILHDTAWDALGYVFSPIVLERQLSGKVYDSYSGRNYDAMRMQAPVLTKYYVDYGCWWFAVGLLLAAFYGMVRAVVGFVTKHTALQEQESVGKSVRWKVIGLYLLSGCCMVAWYTLRGAGRMDYKKTIAVGLLWSLWMLCTCIQSLTEE